VFAVDYWGLKKYAKKQGVILEEEIKLLLSWLCLRYSCQYIPWKNFRSSRPAGSMFIPQYLEIRPQLNG
jgi:hypothetical protein